MTSLACPRPRADACILIGGLGMGYTLAATLDLLPSGGSVVVSEIVPEVVEWNRGPLGPLAGHPLDDPRTDLVVGDVADVIRDSNSRFDAVLLDVDNSVDSFTAGTQLMALHAGGARCSTPLPAATRRARHMVARHGGDLRAQAPCGRLYRFYAPRKRALQAWRTLLHPCGTLAVAPARASGRVSPSPVPTMPELSVRPGSSAQCLTTTKAGYNHRGTVQTR